VWQTGKITITAPFAPIPTVSEWTAIGMTLLLLTAGTIVFFRKRRAETGVA
jgi:LPXTG-motif cell wall-anchored protein